jgi:anti-sigma factor RsiW
MNKDWLNILSNSNKDIDNQQLMDYLSGKLSGEALHEVERSMADNEFLNDAVEGLQQLGNKKNLQARVDELNASMQKTKAAASNAASKKNPGAISPSSWCWSSASSATSLSANYCYTDKPHPAATSQPRASATSPALIPAFFTGISAKCLYSANY